MFPLTADRAMAGEPGLEPGLEHPKCSVLTCYTTPQRRRRRYQRALEIWHRADSGGYKCSMAQKVAKVESVDAIETRSGKTRWVLRDSDGDEFTTFRPKIGQTAAAFEGRRARIEYHEEERNGFQKVYLDGIEAADTEEDPPDELYEKVAEDIEDGG